MDGILDGIAPEVMDEWIAFRNVEADPLVRIIEILKMGFSLLLKAQGVEVDRQELYDMLDPQTYLDRKTPGVTEVTPDQAVRLFSPWMKR